jgi:hypothetical protein
VPGFFDRQNIFEPVPDIQTPAPEVPGKAICWLAVTLDLMRSFLII